MKTLNRTCWWCSKKLMAVSHAVVQLRDGNFVWVHKICEQQTRDSLKKITAQPRNEPPNRAP